MSLNRSNTQRPLFKIFRFLHPICRPIQRSHILEARGHMAMTGSEGLLPDRERALVERLSLRVPALSVVQAREIVQICCHVAMFRTKWLSHR